MHCRLAVLSLVVVLGSLPAAANSSVDSGYWFELPAPYFDGQQMHFVPGDRLMSFGHSTSDEVYLRRTAADSTWRLFRTVNPGPGVTPGKASAYDASSQRLLVVTGGPPGTPAAVWTLDLVTATWAVVPMAGAAPPTPLTSRRFHAVFDPDSTRLLVIDSLSAGASLWIADLGPTPRWTHRVLVGPANPGERVAYAEAWDPAGRRWLFHGGAPDGVWPRLDTWALHADGGHADWELLPFPDAGAFHHALFVDAARNQLIVAAQQWWVYTHALDGAANWNISLPGSSDDARYDVSAAYDAANHALYEHGSSNGTDLFRVSLDDLSLWRPVDSSLGLRTTGPGRDLVPSVVDTRRHQLIALGRGATTVELWSYVAGRHPSWIRMPVVGNAPPTRQREVAVYDSLRDRVLLHGGSLPAPGTIGPGVTIFHDTWAYSLTGAPAWTKLADGGPTVDEYPNARSIVDPTLDRMLISHARDAEGANPGLYAWDLRGAPGWHRVPVAGLSVDSTLGGAAALDPVTERWIFHLGGARVGSIQLSAGGLSWLEWTGISGAPQRMGPDAGGVLDPLGHRFVMFGDVLDLNLIPAMAWALSLDGAAMWSPLGTTGDPPGTRRMPWLAYEDRTDAITLTGGYYSQNDVIELRFDRTFAPVPAAPLTITDVRVNNTTDMTVSLSWTAVGERWLIGHAHHYALHAALHPMADADFDAAPFQSLVIPTVDAGFTETAQLMGLPRDSLLYFAVRAYDGSGTASAISNQPSARPGRAAQVAPGLAFAANPSRSPVTIVWQADPSAPWSPSALRLFDVTGRVRRTVDLGWGPGGSYIWDGRDDDGRRMAAGLYFGRLTSGGKVVKARLVLVP